VSDNQGVCHPSPHSLLAPSSDGSAWKEAEETERASLSPSLHQAQRDARSFQTAECDCSVALFITLGGENKNFSDSWVLGIAPRRRFIKAISVEKPIDKYEIGNTISQGFIKLKKTKG